MKILIAFKKKNKKSFSKKLFYSTSEEQEVLRQVCSVALIPFLETIQTNLVGRLFGQSSILSTDDFGVILCSLESFFLLKELLSSDDRQQSHILFANFLKPITGVTVSIFSAATKAMAMILKKLKVIARMLIFFRIIRYSMTYRNLF